jgi:hypothetical protein
MKTSVSQLGKAHRCMRNWAIAQVFGIWPESRTAQEDGDRLHSYIQNYINLRMLPAADEVDDIAELARMGIAADLYPDKSDAPLVEKELPFSYAGHSLDPRLDIAYEAPSGAIVMDHKTCKNFRYAMTKQKLRIDLQANGCALAAMDKYGVDHVTVVWVYYKKTEYKQYKDAEGKWHNVEPLEVKAPRELKLVELTIEREDAMKVLASYRPTLKRMDDLKSKRVKLPMLEIECNTEACRDYGKCSNVDRCPESPVELRTVT